MESTENWHLLRASSYPATNPTLTVVRQNWGPLAWQMDRGRRQRRESNGSANEIGQLGLQDR